MIGYLAQAVGSPCPTLVLAADRLPGGDEQLTVELRRMRAALKRMDWGDVLKFALVRPSEDPWFDLEFRFAQCLPGPVDRFDLRGNCGHSVLAALTTAPSFGWLPRLAAGWRVRVLATNTHDALVCEVEAEERDSIECTVHFMSALRLSDALLLQQPAGAITVDRDEHRASVVSVGNPYVFVDAEGAGVRTPAELYADNPRLLHTLIDIQRVAQRRLGLPPDGAFPKVALVAQFSQGELAVRSVTVPSWHPTFALTGAVCLGAASAIAGTVPYELARRAGCAPGAVTIRSPGGCTAVRARVDGDGDGDGDGCLRCVSVAHKRAQMITPVLLPDSQTASDLPAAARRAA